MADELLYYIPAGQYGKEGVLSLLAQHPEIKFVSVVGIDLAGNDTDEKIPIRIFKENYDDFFAGRAVQTDGSSVVLMNIATLNDARVDMVTDSSVNWYIDYNYENLDEETGLPYVGKTGNQHLNLILAKIFIQKTDWRVICNMMYERLNS